MLQEGPHDGEVEVVAGDNRGQREAEAVADDLQRDVVHVGAVAGQEDDGVLLARGFGGYRAQAQDLLARDVYALVVRSRQELRSKIVCAADEALALHLADHAVRPRLADLEERLLDLRLPLRLPILLPHTGIVLRIHPQQTLFRLHLYSPLG